MSPNDRPRWMRPVRPEDLAELEAAAAADNHHLVAPNYLTEKGGEIIAAVSVGNVVLAMPWFHTEKSKVADTLYTMNQFENLVAAQMPADGNRILCVPVAQNSPLNPYIERLGYRRSGAFTLAFRQL